MGGKPGEEVEFHFLGDIKGEFTRYVRLPSAETSQYMIYPEDPQGFVAAGLPIRVSNLPNIMESDSHGKMAEAQPIETPSAVNGVIAKPGEIDFYRFTAKKGDVVDINCYARRLRSPLDSVIQVFRFNKNFIAENDDAGGPDSYLAVRGARGWRVCRERARSAQARRPDVRLSLGTNARGPEPDRQHPQGTAIFAGSANHCRAARQSLCGAAWESIARISAAM